MRYDCNLRFSSLESSHRQQVLKFPIVNLQRCINYFGRTLPVTENHICAGGEGQDACSGFGGSPLIQKGQGRYYQVTILVIYVIRFFHEGFQALNFN